jgi:ubiquitin-conjugating enzyme E2 M
LKKKNPSTFKKVKATFNSKKVIAINPEYPELQAPPQGELLLDPFNILEFKIKYTPEKDSYWFGAKYDFTVTIPPEYNISPPKVMCHTRIYHPNIDLKGNVCLNILKDDWRPILNINIVLAGLYTLFTDPNPNDPLNHDAATLMRDSPDQFAANVKKTLRGGYLFGEEFQKFT